MQFSIPCHGFTMIAFSWSTWRELTLTCVLTLQASSPTADGRRDGAARAVWVCNRLLQWHRRLHSSMCTEYTHAGTTGVLMITHFHEQNFAIDTDVTNYLAWNSTMQDIFSCEFIFAHPVSLIIFSPQRFRTQQI